MKESLVVGVAGATGALGKEIVAALERVPWKPTTLVPLARSASKTPFITYDGADIAVDDLGDEVLERLDLLFLALPDEAAKSWGERALVEGVRVVDASGVLRSESVPTGIPWVNPEALSQGTQGALAVPAAESILAASVLGPLARAGLEGDAEATFFVPASRFGRDAIQELSAQVVSLFNAGTPPRKHFPDGLAFDLLPSATEPVTSGWTATELRIREEVGLITGTELTAMRVGVPTFSGLGMELRIEPNRRPVLELVHQILSDGGLEVPTDDGIRGLPRPRRVEGAPFPAVGRIRIDERGEVLRIWAAMDNLRASATVAAGLGGVLLR